MSVPDAYGLKRTDRFTGTRILSRRIAEGLMESFVSSGLFTYVRPRRLVIILHTGETNNIDLKCCVHGEETIGSASIKLPVCLFVPTLDSYASGA